MIDLIKKRRIVQKTENKSYYLSTNYFMYYSIVNRSMSVDF